MMARRKNKILLVEDEESLINVLVLNFEMENFSVDVARDGRAGFETFKSAEADYDLVILDIMIPEINGFDLCARIREISRVPILITSAKGTSNDRVTGLKLGADDYLVKPFNLEELLLRIKILIGRGQEKVSGKGEMETFDFDGRSINFLTYQVIGVDGKKISLSKKEVALLKLLVQNCNKVVSRDRILDEVWGESEFPTSRTVDNYIVGFRKYFEEDPKNPIYFKNIRGVGYKFERAN